MTRAKGTTLEPRVDYLLANSTPGQLKQVLAELGPEYAAEIETGILASRWYPFDFFIKLNRAIDNALGKGDLEFIQVLGRRAAEDVLRGVYKAFARGGTPQFLLQRAATVWDQYYDSGSLEITEETATRMRMQILDFAEPTREHCLSIAGWVEAGLTVTGAKNPKVFETQCRVLGDDECEFVAEWDED